MDGRDNSWEPALLAHHQQTHLHHQRRRKSRVGRRGTEKGKEEEGRRIPNQKSKSKPYTTKETKLQAISPAH